MDREIGNVHKEEPQLPNLTKMKAFDRQQHIQKGLEAGLTREQAEKHADDEVGQHWSPKHIEDHPEKE